jgi:photosystem II core protein PsbZ
MAIILQLLTFLLVILSLFLTVGVPVVLATPGQWEVSKNRIFQFILIWIVLVFTNAFASGFA